MQQGTITNLHLARVKETPSEPVQQATAIANQGLEGDRSCKPGALRQVLVMDKETLDEFDLRPGLIKENITTTGRDMIKILERGGWFLARTRGSHRQYKHPRKRGVVTVAGSPSDDLAPGTLNSILKQAGLER